MSGAGAVTFTLHCGDFRDLEGAVPLKAVVTDPPYNIGFRYNSYADNLPDEEYIEMLAELQNLPVALMHYPEEFSRWVVPALGPQDYTSVWCYNSNIPRRVRLIGYWGLRPDYSRVKMPYKNLSDKRIKSLIENGSEGTGLYEWWDDIQLVKNVSDEKTDHPCPVPVELMKRIILLTTDPGDTVFDPFMGSGTTGVAAIELGREFVGCEIDPVYFAIAEKRIKATAAQEVMFR